MKRQRGRGRKPGHQPNRAFESSGPDVKVRGPAPVIYEKYLQLARDAASAGDRVQAENYQQHAEHYFRVLRAQQPAFAPAPDRFAQDYEYEEGDEGGEAEAGGEGPREGPREGEAAQPYEAREPHGGEGQGHYEQGDYRNRRRGRRNRFRPEGERGGERGEYRNEPRAEGEARPDQRGEYRGEPRGERTDNRPRRTEDYPQGPRGEQPSEGEPRVERAERPERSERPERAERGPRPERGERRPRRTEGDEPPEGFAGQAPAFLAND